MQLEDRILRIGRGIEYISKRVIALGYRFDNPDQAFPGPEADKDLAIERIEREAGEVPLALKLFWRRVGSVDFMGEHLDWKGCEYPDPLVVYPPSAAIEELDEFLSDREERERHGFPYRVPIAPYHKEMMSGGMWYNHSVPAVADDPPLNDEPHETTFVSYLELALRWGGFPGLDRCPYHNWPLDKLAVPIWPAGTSPQWTLEWPHDPTFTARFCTATGGGFHSHFPSAARIGHRG